MKLSIRETVLFGMLGGLMYASKILMDALPNIHLIGVFIVAVTLVYRARALYPLYVFVLLTGLLNGFGTWWIPYLYVWTVLWGAVMLLPKRLAEKKWAPLVYMLVCGLHGLLYGVLYAPFQALVYGLGWQGMLTWIAAGLPFDLIHGISNFCCGTLILPLCRVIRMADKMHG